MPDDINDAILKGNITVKTRPLHERMLWMTWALDDAKEKREDIMLAYFNEAMRIATETNGVTGAYILMCQFYWHVVKNIKNLRHTMSEVNLQSLPEDPSKNPPPDAPKEER